MIKRFIKWWKNETPTPKVENKHKYEVVTKDIEFDELEAEVMLHLIDGTIVRYKRYGEIQYPGGYYKSIITGKYTDYGIKDSAYVEDKPEYQLNQWFNSMYSNEVQYDSPNGKVRVNKDHVIQWSISEPKPTGKKVSFKYKTLQEIK